MTTRNKLIQLIEKHRSNVVLLLRQFRIFEDPSPEVLENTYNTFGMTFQEKLVKIFQSDPAFSNWDPNMVSTMQWMTETTQNQTETTQSQDVDSGGGNFWDFMDNIMNYGDQAANIYSKFTKKTGNTGQSYSSGQDPLIQPVPYPIQATKNNTNTYLIGGAILLILTVVLIVVLRK